MRYYMADFEALTTKPTRVWAWGSCEIGRKRVTYGTDIKEFFEWCEGASHDDNKHVFFHNLSYDGVFIFQYLFNHGFTYDEENKTDKTFNALIDLQGSVYYIDVIFKSWKTRKKRVTFYDSVKKLPFKVKEIAKAFGLEMAKGEIDYKLDRPPGYQLTSEEIDYLQKDVRIVSDAIMIQYKQGMFGMTIGMDALRDYKATIGKYEFKILYPVASEELDTEMRQAYRGGFTYLKKGLSERDLKSGIVLNVNSLYSYIQYTRLMPYGVPAYFDGNYQDTVTDEYRIFILCIYKNCIVNLN